LLRKSGLGATFGATGHSAPKEGEGDAEPPSEVGLANIISLILFSIALLSATIIILCCIALYRTDPIFVMAMSSALFVSCSASAAILLIKKKSTKGDTEGKNNKRNTCNRFYAIRAAITGCKNGVMRATTNLKNANVQKGKQGKDKKGECNKGNKDKDTADCLRHTTPTGGKP
jgi:hypothetical protein